MCRSTALPNAGASCAVKVQPVTLTGARRNDPTHHFSPGEEEAFYPRHEVSPTPCLESFTPDGSRDLRNKLCQPIKTHRDRFQPRLECKQGAMIWGVKAHLVLWFIELCSFSFPLLTT